MKRSMFSYFLVIAAGFLVLAGGVLLFAGEAEDLPVLVALIFVFFTCASAGIGFFSMWRERNRLRRSPPESYTARPPGA